MNNVLLTLRSSLAHFNFELLSIFLDFLSLAVWAPFFGVNNFSCSVAMFTWSSALRVHSWSHLSHSGFHSSSIAMLTNLDGRRISTTYTIACWANSLSFNVNEDIFSVINIGKGNFYLFCYWFYSHFFLTWWATSSSTGEHAEQIVHSSTLWSAIFSSFFSIFIVQFSFIFISQDIVCILNFLELCHVSSFIRVMLDSELSISFFDYIIIGIFVNSKELV